VSEKPAQQLPAGLPEEHRSRVGDRSRTHISYDCTRITYSDPGGRTSREPMGLAILAIVTIEVSLSIS
jgi:hypothetical protein